MARKDRKRSSSSSARKGAAPAGESTEDALEKLFAEAMGSVQSAREQSGKRKRPRPAAPPAPEDVEIEVDLDSSDDLGEAFLEEQSIHYIIDEEPSDGAELDELDEAESFDRLNAELVNALRAADDEPSHEDVASFLRESFGDNALSDDDPDLAFPDFGDEEEAAGEDLTDSSEADLEEVFVVGVDSEPEVVQAEARRADEADGSELDLAETPRKKTALGGLEDAARAQVARMGRLLEERDLVLRSVRDRINGLNAQLVAANRRGAAISREFETFRRRAERDREEHRKYAAEKVLKDFLGVYDNLERALGHAGPDAETPFGQGVSMTLKQFESALRSHGVERVDGAPGSVFDPVHHEAVGQFFSDELPPGAIGTEMQAGFMLHGRLLRAALVTVSRGPEGGVQAKTDAAAEGAPEAEEAAAEGVEPTATGEAEAEAPDAEGTADAEGASETHEPPDADDSADGAGPESATADGDGDAEAPETNDVGDSSPAESNTSTGAVGSQSEDSAPAP